MPRHYEITVEVDGSPCRGTWSIKQGARICVSCGWGAETVDCGSLRPEECAKRTLIRIVRAGQKERAALLKQRERSTGRVNRYWDRRKLDGDQA